MSEEPDPNEASALDFSGLHKAMNSEHAALMDISHEAMQYARKVVWKLRKIQDKFDEHMEELIDLHIIQASALTKIAEELIMAEFDAEPSEEEETGTEEEEDEE